MRTGFVKTAAAVCAGFFAACGGTTAERQPVSEAEIRQQENDALERAKAAADALGVELMSTTAQELAQGGTAAAIRVCSEAAQSISAKHSVEGLQVRRVTLKARNPLNRPDRYERA